VQAVPEHVLIHDGFDLNTFERLLLFMYTNEYTTEPLPVSTKSDQQGLPSTHDPLSAATQTGRTVSHSDRQGQHEQSSNEALAHVLVYEIADHYGVPDLQDLAMEKLKDVISTLTTKDFIRAAEMAYDDLDDTRDDLQRALLSFLVQHHTDWLATPKFANTLVHHDGLTLLAGAVIGTMGEKLLSSTEQHAKGSEVLRLHANKLETELKIAQSVIARLESTLAKMESAKPQASTSDADTKAIGWLSLPSNISNPSFPRPGSKYSIWSQTKELHNPPSQRFRPSSRSARHNCRL
jgi:hypothetical protein